MGVTFYYGQILIQPAQDGSTTHVHKVDGRVEVLSDGQTYTFDAGQVTSITYISSYGGGDTFTSDADYTTMIMTYAGNNHITGGPGYNQVYLMGDNNTYDTGGHSSLVYTYGKNNHITGENLYLVAY